MNRDELRKLAKELNIPGRGRMTVTELREAVSARQTVGTRYRDRVKAGTLIVATPNGVGARDPEGIPIYG